MYVRLWDGISRVKLTLGDIKMTLMVDLAFGKEEWVRKYLGLVILIILCKRFPLYRGVLVKPFNFLSFIWTHICSPYTERGM